MEPDTISADFMHTYIRIHENLVAYYVHLLANCFEVDHSKIVFAAIFHDHGKYAWPQDLFNKNNLTDDDWNIVKMHPKTGIDIVLNLLPEKKEFLFSGSPSVADMIYLHHEKPDGSGYYGVKDIPIEVVLLEIADVFDACLSDRPYRPAMEKEKALSIAISPFVDCLTRYGYNQDFIKKTLMGTFMRNTITKIALCSPKGR